MSQFDVYRLPSGALALDLQSDLVETSLRAIAPLRPLEDRLPRTRRLNPVLNVNGESYVLRMESIATVRASRLPLEPIANLLDQRDKIHAAYDFLFEGL